MARKFGANCSKCQRSTEQQQSIKCFKIHSKDLLQNNDFHITSSIFLLSSVLVFYFFLILFFNSIVYRFFIARIFGVLPEYFRDWGGCRPPRPPGSYAYAHCRIIFKRIVRLFLFPALFATRQTFLETNIPRGKLQLRDNHDPENGDCEGSKAVCPFLGNHLHDAVKIVQIKSEGVFKKKHRSKAGLSDFNT